MLMTLEKSQNFTYYAGIMLDAFAILLCSKLCWHNWLKPPMIFNLVVGLTSLIVLIWKKINTYFVTQTFLMGAAVVQMLNPGTTKTFQEYADTMFLPYVSN